MILKNCICALIGIVIFAGCSYQAKSKLATASDCEDTVLRDSGTSILGLYEKENKKSLEGLYCMVNAVEFPDWAFSDLSSTRPIDGRKSAEWGNFASSWSYDGKKISFTVRIK